jgi:hypothetical protein
MARRLDQDKFRKLFKNRAIVVTDLPLGLGRELAEKVNRPAGPGDSALRTRGEFDALFDELRAAAGTGTVLELVDQQGAPTAAGTAVGDYQRASIGKAEFFDRPMYQVEISRWPEGEMRPETPVASDGQARIALWRVAADDQRHVPPPDDSGILFTSTTFSLVNSGNRTLRTPKRSWKVNVEPGDDDDSVVGMDRLNLKSMFNDPAQMREALAWYLFRRVGIPAARHTYARLAINGAYQGLYSLIEQVDHGFLRDRFGANHRGNLYKGYCGDVGCATLEYRTGPDGDDSGRQYHTPGHDDLTYRLKTNDDDPGASGYDDLALFIRTINGIGLPGGDRRLDSDAFRESVESILNVRAFLRWAGVNLLIGGWDNYFATPQNYYLYNSGRSGAAKDYLAAPYFTLSPWDYDNSFGIDYSGTRWQDTDVLDWPGNTARYWHREGRPDHTSRIPLIQNLFAHHDFAQYYLDHLEYLLDTDFTPAAVAARMGTPDGNGLWQRVSTSAYLESDYPNSPPFTGRQFVNDEVYRTGYAQEYLRHADATIEGIYHYVQMRYDSARAQLKTLRATYPAGASGARFPGVPEPLPERA